MDFSKKYLEKCGWKEGEGLGRHGDGIKKPVRPFLNSNKRGLGFKDSDEVSDRWWERQYSDALNSTKIDVKDKEDHKTCESNTEFEDLELACSSRTMHPGARHGLTFSGKLKRLEEQEKKTLLKKRKGDGKEPVTLKEPVPVDENQDENLCSSTETVTGERIEHKKRKKTKKKHKKHSK